MNVFDDMGIYWGEIADENQTENQLQFIEKAFKAKGLVLDVACGTGRHLIPLAQSGCDIIGLDISPKLLRIAKRRWRDSQLVQGDMRFLPFKRQAFSASISMDTSFGYLPNEQDDLCSLIAIQRTLSSSGVLIVDVFNRELLIKKHKSDWFKQLKWILLPILMKSKYFGKSIVFYLFKWKEYKNFFLLQKRTVIENGKKLHDLWVICDKEYGQIRVFEHTVRLYDVTRLKELLELASLKLTAIYGDYNEQQDFSSSSKRLILVANAEFPQEIKQI